MSTTSVAVTAEQAQSRQKAGGRWIIYALLVIFVAFFLLPVYVAVITSLKSITEVTHSTIWAPPIAPTLENFGKAFNALSLGFRNSGLLVVPGVIISAVLGSLNGYVLSKWKFRGSNLIFTLILFGMFIPYQSILNPLVQFLQSVNLYASIPGLILVHVIYGIPITTLIFPNYYAGVPNELIESGTVDGAGFFAI